MQEVRRDDRLRVERAELAEHEREDLLGLRRVRAGAKLVDDDEATPGEPLEELADAHELGAEAPLARVGGRLLDDGNEKARSRGELRDARRHEETRLREQLREADGLQEARLPARVRPRHD